MHKLSDIYTRMLCVTLSSKSLTSLTTAHRWNIWGHTCYLWVHLCLTENAKFDLWEGNPGIWGEAELKVISFMITFCRINGVIKQTSRLAICKNGSVSVPNILRRSWFHQKNSRVTHFPVTFSRHYVCFAIQTPYLS